MLYILGDVMRFLSRLRNKKEIADIVVERERYYDQFIRTVTPSLIKEHEDYIEIFSDGDAILATCIVVGVPPSQTGRGFPRNLPNNFTDQILAVKLSDCLIGVSYSFSPIAHEESTLLIDNALFNNKISRSEIDKRTKDQTGTSAHSIRYDKEGNDYAELFNTIYDNESRLCDGQYIVTLWSKTYEGLKNGISKIKGAMDTNIVKMDVPYHSILEAFMAAQPYPLILDSAEIQQLSQDCGTLIPLRNPLSTLADNGIIYGLRKIDGAPFVVDFDNLSAGHHLIIGGTRSGKTVFLMKMLMALHDMLGINVVYITVKPDNRTNYLAVAGHYKHLANVINIGNGVGQKNINVLQVLVGQVHLSEPHYVNLFNDHLDLLLSFFKVLDTTDVMLNYVHESVIELYRRNGIIRKDPSTWKDLTGEQWPVLLDLREIWNEDAAKKNVSAVAMLGRTTWFETTCEYASRPTDVTFGKPITIIDLSGVPAVMRDAMNAFVVGMIGGLFHQKKNQKTVVMIDEGRVFLNDKNLAELILKMYTQGGSADIAAWFTTQQPGDIKDDDIKDLLKNNSFGNVVLGNVKPASYKILQKFFNLSDEDIELLRGCGMGQGLVQINDIITAVDFKLTDLEAEIIIGQEKQGPKAPEDVGFRMVDNRFKILAEDNHAYMEDWIHGDSKSLSPGRDRFPTQRALKSGSTGIWIKSSKIKSGMVLNQTIDHYATVLQIASYLIYRGSTVEVNHLDGPDVVANVNNHTICIEYERPGTHTVNQLIERNQELKTKYEYVVFVTTSANFKLVSAENCIGQNNTVARGAMLREYIDGFLTCSNHETTESEVVSGGYIQNKG